MNPEAGGEPTRSRLVILLGVALLVALTLARSSEDPSEPFAELKWILVAAGLLLAVFAVFWWLWRRGRHRRPARFVLTGRGFGVTAWMPLGLMVMTQTLVASTATVPAFEAWRDLAAPDPNIGPEDPTITIFFGVVFSVMAAAFLVPIGIGAALAWRGFPIELTPAGIRMVGPFLYRRIPWEALAPGGPPRPLWPAHQLALSVARPDLVVQRGLALGSGGRQWPLLPLHVRTHPWFVADAIAWYVAHPEHRAAIGTPDEHARLVAALTAGTSADEAYPADPPTPTPRPVPPPGSRPRAVRVAARLTYAGVAVALLAAAADLAVAVGMRDEIRAAEEAIEATAPDGLSDGESLIGFGTADFALTWASVALALAALAGLAAVLLARATARGREQARVSLTIFAGASIAWAACPCVSPTMSVADAPDVGWLGAAWPELWMLPRGAIFGLAVAVLVLLLQPSVIGYTRSQSAPPAQSAPPTPDALGSAASVDRAR